MIKSLLPLQYIVLFLALTSCNEQTSNSIPDKTILNGEEAFEEAKEVSYTLADGFDLDLWAPGPLLANAVALTFDPKGNAYVSETYRRKSSDLDIRQHRDWMIEDIGLESLEDTKEFHLRKLATDLGSNNEWQKDFNEDGIHDYKDLEVQSEIIMKISDSNGDGRADVSHIYADGINELLTGVAAGVLYHDGDVFVTAAPNVYRFRDTDGDGDYDTKDIISRGYGIHIGFAGHDMSGLTVGHDGKIYWSIGDLGVNVLDKNGKRWKYPNQGAVMRCNPDGSDFEVYAHGLRNPQEIHFDAYGNLISVDNDGDHPGEKERYVHIVEGSDTGWRINWQYGKYNMQHEKYKVWMDEGLYLPHFEGQAAYITPPFALASNGPAGLAYNPGTALGDRWKNHFFASYFTGNSKRSKLQAFTLKAKGSSFELDEEIDIINGINNTGICFGPDGALYVNDWKESYDKKEAGRVWKLDTRQKHAERASTASLLSKGGSDLGVDELKGLISHNDMRVRRMSQFELVKRNEQNILLDLCVNATNELGRLHAIWGYGMLMRKDPKLSKNVFAFLSDKNNHIRSQTAKVLGDAKNNDAYNSLIPLLSDSSARVRFFVIEALGKLGNNDVFDSIVKELEATKDQDTHLRHAAILALSRLATDTQIESLHSHTSHHVRLGAVVALRELSSPLVQTFLNDQNKWVVTEAARAINDDFSIPEAVEALALSLKESKVKEEAFLRRAINANLRIGDSKSADRLYQFISDNRNDITLRKDALWALGSFADPLSLDRVDNRYRELDSGDVVAAKASIKRIFDQMDGYSDIELKVMIITVAGRLKLDEASPKLFELIKNTGTQKEIRKSAMTALVALNSDQITEAINIALESDQSELRIEAQKVLNQADFSDEFKIGIISKILNKGNTDEKQSAISSLAKIKTKASVELFKDQIENISKLDPGITLDIIEAASNLEDEGITSMLAAYEANKAQDDNLEMYSELLYGGDIKQGQNLFIYNESGQCMRCHKIQGYGGEVGPPLDNIADRLTREDLLLALVAPNDRIAEGYGNAIYTLKDGSDVIGTVHEDKPDELSIMQVNNEIISVQKNNISEQENMPSGMPSQVNNLTKREIRNLVAFLSNLKNGKRLVPG